MDFNRLTLKSQEAIAAAQELARRRGNPEITPDHLLLALLEQELPRTLLAGAPTRSGRGGEAQVERLPSSRGRAAAAAGRRGVLARTRPRRGRDAEARGRVRLDRAPAARARRRPARRAAREAQGRPRRQRVTIQDPEGTYQALEKFGRDLTDARRDRQARPGHRPRRGDPPRDPGALAPDEEQSGPDRRSRRRQDGDRRRARAARSSRATSPRA